MRFLLLAFLAFASPAAAYTLDVNPQDEQSLRVICSAARQSAAVNDEAALSILQYCNNLQLRMKSAFDAATKAAAEAAEKAKANAK